MKEFVEKLIGRLDKYTFSINTEELYYDKAVGMYELLKIVNQLAEECNNDFCEWSKQGGYNFYLHKTSCGTEDTFDDSYVFCPYCGKKIKILE